MPYFESIALWVTTYAKKLCLSWKYYSWKVFAYWFSCLAFIYVVANYRPLLWITSFITCFTVLVDQDYVGSMSPQKLFCFYRLPTRGRVGTKLGDAWYVSNVSIISDVPCSYYIICHMFYMHYISLLWHLLD